MKETILSIENLTVELPAGGERRRVLHGISFEVYAGEILGLVGESGSGKSVTASAVMQLLPGGSKAVTGGKILFKGKDLLCRTPAEMQTIRGKEIAMIFQEPMTSLNPVFTIGTQFVDIIRTHQAVDIKSAAAHALNMLKAVHISDPQRTLKSYPYELSGGMRQRVMIAMAQSCSPSLLIADEPTTALDVTIQAQILRLLRTSARSSGSSAIFISHDLGVISQLCQRVAVMYAGEIVEFGPVDVILQDPKHPYTKALLTSIPDFRTQSRTLTAIPGTVPGIRTVINGCRFHPRCAERQAVCEEQKPEAVLLPQNHRIHCWQLLKESH